MKVVRANSAEAFEKVIEKYRIQNPVKAAKKEAEWAKKLAQLRAQDGTPVEEAPEVEEVEPRKRSRK